MCSHLRDLMFSTSVILYMNKTVNITAFVQCFYLKIQMLQTETTVANFSIFTHIRKKKNPETDCGTNVLLQTPPLADAMADLTPRSQI